MPSRPASFSQWLNAISESLHFHYAKMQYQNKGENWRFTTQDARVKLNPYV